MGPCQAASADRQPSFLFGWNAQSTRPPVFPVKLKTMAGEAVKADFS